MARAKTVAIINSNEDIIDAIRLMLDDEGYITVSGHVVSFKRGEEDYIKFLKENKPDAIIFDIAPPYEENWNFFRLIANLKESEKTKYILTTTNKRVLEELVGATDTLEIIGKPFDLQDIVNAVKKAVK